jgi:hypothetical protein
MATETLVIKDDTPTSSTYNLMAANGSEVIYRDAASTLSNPRVLRVSHQIAKSNDGIDRSLVSLSRVDDDADDVPFTGSVHIVVSQPRDGVTQANLILEWEKLKNIFDANVTDIFGGFFPSNDCP